MTTTLPSRFKSRVEYTERETYHLLPFHFLRLDNQRVLLTNMVGEFTVLSTECFDTFCAGTLEKSNVAFKELLAKHMVMEPSDSTPIELLNIKVQNKIQSAADFTGLHIFVVTLRCDHSCQYCQVSRQNADVGSFDMSKAHADTALGWVFKSPNQHIKIEFQGGESLLNFDLIKHVVTKANELNGLYKKEIQFVIATNLVFLNDEILQFASQTGICFSTSLDGPADLHNANRPRPERNSFELAIAGINRVRAELGYDRVSALMTTTHRSLPEVERIVDTYLQHGFNGIFLRPLSPFGFASKTRLFNKYSQREWLDFYEKGMNYIVELNRVGIPMQEFYTTILLRKMLTPYGTGYVDLQNPSGSAIGAVVFNFDGKVFASDEGRMLAEMDNQALRIGDLDKDTYESTFGGSKLIDMLQSTMLECSPMCSDCAYQHWCGVDIAHHVATQGDLMGHKAFSSFCTRHMGMFRSIIDRMEQDAFTKQLFLNWSWR